MLYPNAPVLFFFVFQIPAKYMVWILGGIAFLSSARGAGSGVSHVAHLGGMLAGFVLIRKWRGRRARRSSSAGTIAGLRERYRRWKFERAKKKFQVYLKKRGSGGPWVH
jgi:membrane associated rhomboid family serine protease